MKAIMISIQPKWVAKILNGEKTIEIRKTLPRCEYPIDVYIYCTIEDSLIKLQERYKDRYVCERNFECEDFPKMYSDYEGKGKVVAKFTLKQVDRLELDLHCGGLYLNGVSSMYVDENGKVIDLPEMSQLDNWELIKYVGGKGEKIGSIGYAWHIDNLVIFDKPKELSEFRIRRKCLDYNAFIPLDKAPQNWCYVEVVE